MLRFHTRWRMCCSVTNVRWLTELNPGVYEATKRTRTNSRRKSQVNGFLGLCSAHPSVLFRGTWLCLACCQVHSEFRSGVQAFVERSEFSPTVAWEHIAVSWPTCFNQYPGVCDRWGEKSTLECSCATSNCAQVLHVYHYFSEALSNIFSYYSELSTHRWNLTNPHNNSACFLTILNQAFRWNFRSNECSEKKNHPHGSNYNYPKERNGSYSSHPW